MISSTHVTSFVQENGESDDSDSTEEDNRENITQTYEQIEAVNNEYEDSADDQHQNSSQGSPGELYGNPVNQEAPEKKCKTVSATLKKYAK